MADYDSASATRTLELVKRLLRVSFDATESWTYRNIGFNLAYLVKALVDTGDGFDIDNAIDGEYFETFLLENDSQLLYFLEDEGYITGGNFSVEQWRNEVINRSEFCGLIEWRENKRLKRLECK